MTKIVNIKTEQYDVYIGRAGKGKDGYFGNAHPIGFCLLCLKIHDRESSIAAFKQDFDIRIITDGEYRERVTLLKDKTLGYFCKNPNFEVACHGDIYKEYLDGKA